MNKIQKAMQRNRENTEQRAGTPELSDREQLEHDIRMLLSEECPDILGTMKKQIRLSYTRTRTVPTDPASLAGNHIYTLSQCGEITKHFEVLKAIILKKLKAMRANSLIIASANHGEGKTFISTNLAVSIAQNLDRTVMLVDADLRNRSSKQRNTANIADVFFNSESESGLSDFLSGTAAIEDLLVNPGIPGLTILPSGKALPDSAALLASPKMEDMINDMKSRYSIDRILIFDCSSFLSSADALVLSRFVDAVLLVVENERTETKALQRMIELLDDKKIIGTVINKSRNCC